MHDNIDPEILKDEKAQRREQKKRPRMRQHGRGLKLPSARSIHHLVKIKRKKK